MSTLTTQEKAVREPAAAQRQPQAISPRVDIYEKAEEYTLVADMPGVGRSETEVQLDNGELTISGHRAATGGALPVEYRRAFSVDPAIDSGKISAKVENGVLTVTLPKPEAVKPRQIQIS